MKRTPKLAQPFFAYGIFRPRQLAFFQLRDSVSHVTEPVEVPGSLLLRDGLPIVDPNGPGYVTGALLTFLPDRVEDAYSRVSAMEPDEQYLWQEVLVNGTHANMLVGRSPRKGSVPCEDAEWDGWSDPLFTAALDVVTETLGASQEFEWDLKPIFRLQMAYLLLWSSMERYVSLRYYLGNEGVSKTVRRLADEPAFAASLRQCVSNRREVYRADRPSDKEVLDSTSPHKSIAYYYQVRSNITHRGKGAVRDYETLRKSLTELLAIFRDVLRVAQDDARVKPT